MSRIVLKILVALLALSFLSSCSSSTRDVTSSLEPATALQVESVNEIDMSHLSKQNLRDEFNLDCPIEDRNILNTSTYRVPEYSTLSEDGLHLAVWYQTYDEDFVSSAGDAGGGSFQVKIHDKNGNVIEAHKWYGDNDYTRIGKHPTVWVTNGLLLIDNSHLYSIENKELTPLTFPSKDVMQEISEINGFAVTDTEILAGFQTAPLVSSLDGKYLVTSISEFGAIKAYIYSVDSKVWSEIDYDDTDDDVSSANYHKPTWAQRKMHFLFESDTKLYFCTEDKSFPDVEQKSSVRTTLNFYSYDINTTKNELTSSNGIGKDLVLNISGSYLISPHSEEGSIIVYDMISGRKDSVSLPVENVDQVVSFFFYRNNENYPILIYTKGGDEQVFFWDIPNSLGYIVTQAKNIGVTEQTYRLINTLDEDILWSLPKY